MSELMFGLFACGVVFGLWYFIINGVPFRNRPVGPPRSKAESLRDRRID
jgi:hypothetical protein